MKMFPMIFEVPCIIVHGGIQNSENEKFEVERFTACKKAASHGYKKIVSGFNALEAVEASIRLLEDNEIFNCGYGSAANSLGEIRMDAQIMRGNDMKCGSVMAVSGTDHPISLAKIAMENSPNTIWYGDKAVKSIGKKKIGIVTPASMKSPRSIATPDLTMPVIDHETVGCVAYDGSNIAVGCSTGGIFEKTSNSVSGCSIIGCGIFADSDFACSLTGCDKTIAKFGLARRIVETRRRENLSSADAFHLAVNKIMKNERSSEPRLSIGGVGLRTDGDWGFFCSNGEKMPFAFAKKDEVTYGVKREEAKVERILNSEDLEQFKWENSR